MSAGKRGKANAGSGAGGITPGAHLRAELERLGLDQVAVSKAAGVSRQTVNNVVNGRQRISRAMAGKLGRLTGHPSDYWLAEWFAASGRKRGAARIASTGLLVDHQIARAVKDGVIGIAPFAPNNLRATSIDLTLHGTITIAGGDRVVIARGKAYALKSGSAVNASTVESIDLPRDYLGRLGAIAALGARGIVVSGGLHVEPGFSGRLRFSLFNAGTETFVLRPGDQVIALEILRLSATPDAAA